MATKNNPGSFDCYANAHPDEPMFILLGRDAHAPTLVRSWASLREALNEDPLKVAEARAVADQMDAWRLEREAAVMKQIEAKIRVMPQVWYTLPDTVQTVGPPIYSIWQGGCDLYRVRGHLSYQGLPILDREVYVGPWVSREEAEAELKEKRK